MRSLGLIFCFSLMTPTVALAAVTINEVAWMGDTVSANYEWIELLNSGEAAVSLEGWTLSDGMNLSIPLTGVVSAGGYAVLERTSDASAPGGAFLIYTGALVNTGATLVLYDQTGAIVDQVAGGENWQGIGGDNSTKETAQYTQSGWITAPGTPGRINASVGTAKEVSVTSGSVAAGAVAKPSPTTKLVLSRTSKETMIAELLIPARAFVGQVMDFSVAVSGVGTQLEPSIRYEWNFGDTYTAVGKQVSHTYSFPGEYMVTLRATVAGRTAVAEALLTVLPIEVSLTRSAAGDVQVNNDTVYPIDVSGYHVRGNMTVVLPEGTILAPRGTITIASTRLESVPGMSLIALADRSGTHQAYVVPTLFNDTSMVAVASDVTHQQVLTDSVTVWNSEFFETLPEVAAVPLSPVLPSALAAETDLVGAKSSEAESSPASASTRYYIGLFCILLAAIVMIWSWPKSAAEPVSDGL